MAVAVAVATARETPAWVTLLLPLVLVKRVLARALAQQPLLPSVSVRARARQAWVTLLELAMAGGRQALAQQPLLVLLLALVLARATTSWATLPSLAPVTVTLQLATEKATEKKMAWAKSPPPLVLARERATPPLQLATEKKTAWAMPPLVPVTATETKA
jgi:hypothetical protein